jgi:ABC-type branched-subunit amino acid transport system substrate-binding protein
VDTRSEQWTVISGYVLVTVHCLVFTACAVTRPTLKIGLAAPFEGRYRNIGYEVIYAVRMAVREANAAGGVAGYSVELVALDDSGDPQRAVEQARKLAADPQVLGVIGHWRHETTAAAAAEYDQAGIPLLATASAPQLPASAFRLSPAAMPCQPATLSPCPQTSEELWMLGAAAGGVIISAPAPLPADSADPAFAERYRAISNDVEPRFNAVLAYDATRVLLDAIAREVKASGRPTRLGIAAALSQTDYSGLSGHFSFDSNHNWIEAQAWRYTWRDGQFAKP